MESISSDVVVVGSGVAGLWSAKELIDQGLSVHLVERSTTLADGATTRNEGWLHAGTYHSVAVEDEASAQQITERTLFGYKAINQFAPDSIDHPVSYALVASDSKLELAQQRWNKLGIEYEEVSADELAKNDGIDPMRISAAFKVADKSVNSAKLCKTLHEYLLGRDCQISTGSHFAPVDENHAELSSNTGEVIALEAEKFLITAGSGIKDLFRQVTGQEPFIRFFKAHLMLFPRLTRDNYFYIDTGEAGVMNHDKVSVVGINRDGIELEQPDNDIDSDKVRLVYNAVTRMIPRASQYAPSNRANVKVVACCKPDIFRDASDTQNLNAEIIEPETGYVFALPGKMTEAPYLAYQAMVHILGERTPKPIQYGPVDTTARELHKRSHRVTPRPADTHMSTLSRSNTQLDLLDGSQRIGA